MKRDVSPFWQFVDWVRGVEHHELVPPEASADMPLIAAIEYEQARARAQRPKSAAFLVRDR
ncbi:MAG: hypothetical protein KA310_03420 [Pseudomonadales bacterium]|nr:hypothetical protein [Pseudomonadales bacterium]